jgi:hypothetical protein
MLQVTTWLPNAVSSADDTQIPSIENALYFLSCGPTEIAWVRLLERGDRCRLDRCPWPFSKQCQLTLYIPQQFGVCLSRKGK